MKRTAIISILLFAVISAQAQRINNEDKKFLQQKEDSLKVFADKLINGNSATIRFSNDSLFTRMFVKALKTNHSFNFRFDSLITISKLYPPDSSFRIFSWQMVVNENLVRQHGAIQMKTADGSLKLFPLIDKSDVTLNIVDTVANNLGWMGAVYYKILQNRSSNQNYYTLLGYDENNIRSSRKIIEVLSFSNDAPLFGGRYFSYEEDTSFKSATSRYVMEYKKSAGARLAYDADLNMIIAEHLESETNEPKKKWTFIPDGDYEGFKWKNGKWVHVEKVFTQITPEGMAPMPNPVKDAMGNTVEEKLKDNIVEDNEPAAEKAPVKKTTTPVKKQTNKKGGEQ